MVSTDNANAVNEALTIESQCVLSYKNMHALDGGCTTGYIGILQNVLEIILFGEMVSQKKTPGLPWLLQVGVKKGIEL